MYTILNDTLEVAAQSAGAELTSVRLRSDNTEHLWQADPTIWGRHAPILFPIVGRLRDDRYIYNDKTYTLEKHGFARNSEFQLAEHTADSIRFTLASTPATRTKFPFEFFLSVEYRLIANSLRTTYTVENRDTNRMYFSIGGHPAFRCPLVDNEELEDCFLEFDSPEVATTELVDDQALVRGEFVPVLNNETRIPITKDMFNNDAIILRNLQSTTVAIRSRKSSKSVTMDFTGFPFLGIWAVPGAPYVCLEPWYGIADPANATGHIEGKLGIQSLGPAETFTCHYDIVIS